MLVYKSFGITTDFIYCQSQEFITTTFTTGMCNNFSATCFVFIVKMSLSWCGCPGLDDVSMSGFLRGTQVGILSPPFDHKLAFVAPQSDPTFGATTVWRHCWLLIVHSRLLIVVICIDSGDIVIYAMPNISINRTTCCKLLFEYYGICIGGNGKRMSASNKRN